MEQLWHLVVQYAPVVIAPVVTFFLGLALIKPRLSKAVTVIGDIADLLSCVKSALADEKLDKAEVEEIIKEAQELIAEFK